MSGSTAPGVAYAYIDDYRRNRRDIFTSAKTLDALSKKQAEYWVSDWAFMPGLNESLDITVWDEPDRMDGWKEVIDSFEESA